MRAGKHYVTFVIGGADMPFAQVGIIRPLKNWDKKGLECFDPKGRDHFDELQQERTERWGDSKVQVCSVSGFNILQINDWDGSYATQHSWEGQHQQFVSGDRIGMLLNLDSGTLTVYKNSVRIGTISTVRLSGEYCWYGAITIPGPDIRIEKGSTIPTD